MLQSVKRQEDMLKDLSPLARRNYLYISNLVDKKMKKLGKVLYLILFPTWNKKK
ncbi:hypothetical protein ES702_04126 [subsurface metagenome]